MEYSVNCLIYLTDDRLQKEKQIYWQTHGKEEELSSQGPCSFSVTPAWSLRLEASCLYRIYILYTVCWSLPHWIIQTRWATFATMNGKRAHTPVYIHIKRIRTLLKCLCFSLAKRPCGSICSRITHNCDSVIGYYVVYRATATSAVESGGIGGSKAVRGGI